MEEREPIADLQHHLRRISRAGTRLTEVTIDGKCAPATGFWCFPKDFDLFCLTRHICNGVETVVFEPTARIPGVWNLLEYRACRLTGKKWDLMFPDNDWRPMGSFCLMVDDGMGFEAVMKGVATVGGVTDRLHQVGKRYRGRLENLPQLHPYPVDTIRLGSRATRD